MWKEFLDSDTFACGPGSTVAKVIDGSVHSYKITAISAVTNTGSDTNWCGHHFGQANWYAFGRLAWDPRSDARDIALDWVRRTFNASSPAQRKIVDIMMESREAVVDYMTPLGLAHLMGTGHHYGPAPWVADLARPEWNPVYYHRADASGIGFDRTASGSNALAQYAPAVQEKFAVPSSTPLEFLLWFHRVEWQAPLPSGRTLWHEMLFRYDRGVAAVLRWRQQWDLLAGEIDPQRHQQVAAMLAVQAREARWWRDASVPLLAASRRAAAAQPAWRHRNARWPSTDQHQFPYAPGR